LIRSATATAGDEILQTELADAGEHHCYVRLQL